VQDGVGVLGGGGELTDRLRDGQDNKGGAAAARLVADSPITGSARTTLPIEHYLA
jgi:hypothetical protein